MLMIKNKENKLCTFFVSDYHFEMISLPYINRNIDSKKGIVIFTENDLNNSVDTLISKMNLKEESKNKLLNINWDKNDLKKFEDLKKNLENNKEVVIFVKGKEDYIKNINENIEKNFNSSNIEIVDCYEFSEIKEKMNTIVDNYEKVLNVQGMANK